MIKAFYRKSAEAVADFFSLIVRTLFRLLPWSFNPIFAKVIAFLWYDLLRIRRRVILGNLDIAFPNMTKAEKAAIARQSIQASARSFVDILRIPSLNLIAGQPDQEWIDKNVVFHGVENVKLDSGILFMSLHLGSGDIAAAIISQSVKPISLITKRFKNPFVDRFWFSFRSQAKTKFIDPHVANNSFEILRALKEKRGVTFVIDQFMGKPYGVESQFFGKTTGTAYGLALFALKTKAPLIPLYTRWDQADRLHIYFEPALDLSPYTTEDIEVNKTTIMNYLNSVLEDIITQYPGDWMWLHRRWKKFE